ncbi:S-adenosylmethionine:tRNA ribosyltransferase-isomerase [Streptomyces sp. NPDC008086]|uniref:S-adenosylmethionine:tRNA ribosyltransferase-isomerase n=1 Tax=Streptomyces sp. NPDC008086 TaxID=3364807 RepID=UPI0036E393B0
MGGAGPGGRQGAGPEGIQRVRSEGKGGARAGAEGVGGAGPGGRQGAGSEGIQRVRSEGSRVAATDAAGEAGFERGRATQMEGREGAGPGRSRAAGGDGPGGAGPRGARAAAPVTDTPEARGARTDETPAVADDGTGILRLMREYGRPIRYSYTERDQPLSVYQTVFALPSGDGAGSAEMPSAARPFTVEMVTELVSRGVQFAPVTLHTGVASAEAHEPPYPERFAVTESSARLINAVRAGGGRVVAVGTTAVRAVESAVGADGVVRARAGWTDLVVTPERGVRAVDGLLTGLHEPEASHLLMLEAVAGRAAIDRGYEAALHGLYLWHEFGDVHLVLPGEDPHAEHCASNCQ